VDYISMRMKKTLLLALFLCAAQAVRADDVPASEAYSHVGETVTVCGKVTGVHYAANSEGKPTFINFDKPYPNQDFTVMSISPRFRVPGFPKRASRLGG
jgi:hypothetical protein